MNPAHKLFTRHRAFVVAPVLGLAAFAGAQQIGAQVMGGHNSNAPVDYAADRIELQDREGRVVLSGNVDVKQADLRVRAARTVVNFTNTNSMQIQRITASGGVNVTRGGEVATGDVGVYDFNQRIITMTGNAMVKRANGDVLRGARLVVDLKSGVSSASGGSSGGRVTGTFSVPKQ